MLPSLNEEKNPMWEYNIILLKVVFILRINNWISN